MILIKNEIDKHSQDTNNLTVLEDELELIERQLKSIEQEQHQLLQWALKGFPENQVESENYRLNKSKLALKARKVELEAHIKASQETVINVPELVDFVEDIQNRLPTLDFEGKRLALEMLGIKVFIDGDTAEVRGTISPGTHIPRCPSHPKRLTGARTPVL
ncbi:MAG: hypothetical protein TUN42_00775 [Dehalogenimonas sp.]